MAPLPGGEEALRCSFCGKRQEETAKIISAPSSYDRAYICEECVRTYADKLSEVPARSVDRAVKCSFCHKGADVVRIFPSGGDPANALICEECLTVCKMIIEDDRFKNG
jgi:ATP-dependent protease Clp ATPase subunit